MAAAKDPEKRRRRWPRWLPAPTLLIGLVALVAVVVVVLQAHSAERDVVAAFRHFQVDRLPWLALAIGIEGLSFLCYAQVQRRLLAEGGAHLRLRSVLALAVGATGMTNLVPGGTAPASGWLVAQYRRRNVPMPVALWSVIAGGYLAGVSILVLLLVGAAVAGLLPPWAIVVCAEALVGGAVLLVVLARRVDVVERFLERHRARRFAALAHRAATQLTAASEFRTSRSAGVEVIVLSLANWALDVGCLVAAFTVLDLPIPWHNALFAYAVAQVAGSLAPVPGGIGFVEGGMVGAFALTGTPAGDAFAAIIVYRFITTWLVAAVGSVMLVVLSRSAPPGARLDRDLGSLTRDQDDTVGPTDELGPTNGAARAGRAEDAGSATSESP
ncbi:MAG: YbhN family protein [Actinomycetota bacterium]|nr:YbhN family protein [Actinomycetota bacterium]